MQRIAPAPATAQFAHRAVGAWLARRWYYTPKSRRAYSVRQVSPGDRRMLADLSLALTDESPERERDAVARLSELLFERLVMAQAGEAAGFVALENAGGADRAIGVCAYAMSGANAAEFAVAVANSFRGEQVGRTLLESLLRHARRSGLAQIAGEMSWSNRAMQALAGSLGFSIEPLEADRTRRRLVLTLR